MRVVVVYKDNRDYTRLIDDFLSDFLRRTGHQLETLDPESLEGELFCRAYDIVEYPSVVALSDDGKIVNSWRGTMLPTISEVSYYVQ
ncbi:hypothetical protein EOL96_04015 [Candidatus Saccharibacteria bacterium]|nr:hypothetical protein [Candidatus Saccharibacteria bacterium]